MPSACINATETARHQSLCGATAATCGFAAAMQGIMPKPQLQERGLELRFVQRRQLLQLRQAPLADLLLAQLLLLGPLCLHRHAPNELQIQRLA